MNVKYSIIINNKFDFDKLVKYIKRLETVTSINCDRCHNKKKYARAILPLAKLCVDCQTKLNLRSKYEELIK